MAGDEIYPKARRDKLVVTALDDELLIQDTAIHRAHGLNAIAACIWVHCDGTKTVPELTAAVSEDLGEPVDERAIWYALSVFQRKRLLAKRVVTKENRMSRKRAVRTMGIAAGLAAVASITIPDAMAHASVCIGRNERCVTPMSNCCVGCTCLATSMGGDRCLGSCV